MYNGAEENHHASNECWPRSRSRCVWQADVRNRRRRSRTRCLRTAKVGGPGGFDYVYADVANRRLYIPRGGSPATATAPAVPGRVTVFDLDTLAPVGEIANTRGNGAAVDPKSGHGFASSKPVAMWDTRTLALIKTIDVQGNPDGILFDSFNDRVYVFSHAAPHTTVIDCEGWLRARHDRSGRRAGTGRGRRQGACLRRRVGQGERRRHRREDDDRHIALRPGRRQGRVWPVWRSMRRPTCCSSHAACRRPA